MTKQGLFILCLLLLSACGRVGSLTGPSGDPFGTGGKNQISTEVGNGGSGVFCPGKDGARPYFEVMDVYEARKRGMPPELGGPELSVEQKLEIALGRLARLSPARAKRYHARTQDILKGAYFFHSGYLPHIADEDPADLTEGCRLLQIATRRKPIFDGDPEFLIDGNLWAQLDADNQAALLGHEVAYDEASKQYGQTTSRMARAFNSIFFSKRIETMSERSFFAFLDKIGFTMTDFAGVEVPTRVAEGNSLQTGSTRFDGDTVLSAAWQITQQEGDMFVKPLRYDYFGTPLIAGYGLRLEATFSKSGHLSSFVGGIQTLDEGKDPGQKKRMINDRGNLIRISGKGDNVLTTFFEDGHFHTVSLAKGSTVKVKGSGELSTLQSSECVTFDRDGFAENFNGQCYAPKAD